MINLKHIVKTSFIFWLKKIIAILLIILLIIRKIIAILLIILIAVGSLWLALITNKFFIELDQFLTIKLNFALLYSVGVFTTMYYFWSFLFKFIVKIFVIYDNWR